jgi:hypothetical protein
MKTPTTELAGCGVEQRPYTDSLSLPATTPEVQHGRRATPDEAEVINSAELARRLGVPESWVRSRSNPKRTGDPIPHYKFGRYVQFPWGSEVLRAWLNRQLVSTDRAGHSRRNE